MNPDAMNRVSTVGRINIVSTDIQLWENTNHPETQELRNKFIQILKEEYKLNGGIAEKFWKVLEGAAYMGSLLQPKEELDKLLQDAMEKNILFVVGNGRDRSVHDVETHGRASLFIGQPLQPVQTNCRRA